MTIGGGLFVVSGEALCGVAGMGISSSATADDLAEGAVTWAEGIESARRSVEKHLKSTTVIAVQMTGNFHRNRTVEGDMACLFMSWH
jgi:hypothetical protein